MSKTDIQLRFPKPRKKALTKFHAQYLSIANALDNSVFFDNREKFIALERLEESYMWAIKSLNTDENQEA